MTSESTAQALLDAQVSWVINRLTGDELPELATKAVDDVLAVAENATISALVDPATVKSIARTLATNVPPSTAASTLVEHSADVLYSNPAGTYTLRDVIDRDNVGRITDEVIALTPLLEDILDDLTHSPMTAALASRFVGRIVNDVIAGNRAVAEKIPGVGSLVSFGAKTAGKAIGKTGEQFGELFGDATAKGAEFAMGRLNKIIIATLKDPSTRAAVLEVFDLYADEKVGRLDQLMSVEDVRRIGGIGQDVVIAAAVSEPVLLLVDALIDGFFTVYGDSPAAEVLDDLDLSRDTLVEYAVGGAPRLFDAVKQSGELERIVREQLEPFYSSPEVAAILGKKS
ncbi:MAG TPA: hypothetical protein PK331_04480 [Gordonia sp. (in: high G+C Gram-positive bacteria)]|uniref:hypothetical protein n=1 Tax=unclassified Gordonia (in: high G+C Gram-positive bacteria) TaxID=2657482 RepID=UPI000FA02001|nr:MULTISPECIES: hypothetical protein [unclassified Gordonia (in: high G+C Gram-positive bacteria)]RUP40084.1 MAG: hypothetical protein EKK60_04895 [Gordonia sp. (in: high G+C Gram-positive bacteria)]HNP57202.1 hypothetical protein [Gordonia sp. (in: high G+C Gram-positive bacteria)]HRC50170.1 hypothetical protein [Gordonia sp. (in: high G+C Gram-positive bacteria)]